VKRLRALHTPSGRREQNLLLLEGTHLLQEALRLGLTPDLLLATPAWCERHASLLDRIPSGVRVQPVQHDLLAAMATTQHPDGVLATLPLAALPPADPAVVPTFVLALDRLQDPGNLGTLMRTALAAGVEQLWLCEGADPLQPKVLRSSSGAALALPLLRLEPDAFAARLRQARAAGLQLVASVVTAAGPDAAAAPAPPPPPYWQLDWRRPTLLLLGNEGSGLAEDVQQLADRRVTIPHSPAVESLNVAVAAAPLLLERWRQNQAGVAG
jgi:TrmH family RNA methyltransferase